MPRACSRSIRSLPEAYRETLVLRLVEGMTGPEIAARTGLTAASVRVNLHRGMKMLRERTRTMTDHEPDAPSDYLWDGTGAPDEEIVRLEETLRPLRHQGDAAVAAGPRGRPAPRALDISAMAGGRRGTGAAGRRWCRSRCCCGSADWSVSSLAGAPAVDGRAVTSRARMSRGDWLVTDNGSRARVAVGGIGTVEVEPNTRLQLVANDRVHRMALERGTIHARIWAPPKLFVVNTEAATAIDLGCAYTLQMDERRRHAAGHPRLGGSRTGRP